MQESEILEQFALNCFCLFSQNYPRSLGWVNSLFFAFYIANHIGFAHLLFACISGWNAGRAHIGTNVPGSQIAEGRRYIMCLMFRIAFPMGQRLSG